MTDKHESNSLNTYDVVPKENQNGTDTKQIVEWSQSNPSEKEIHNALSLTSEELRFEQHLSTISPIKAPPGSGKRILTAVFEQSGIEREPRIGMNNLITPQEVKKTDSRKATKIVVIILSMIVVFGVVFSVSGHWTYLGSPEILIQAKNQMEDHLLEVASLEGKENKHIDSFRTKEISRLRKRYIAALTLMEDSLLGYSLRLNIVSMAGNGLLNGQPLNKWKQQNIEVSRMLREDNADSFLLIEKDGHQDWSFDTVPAEVSNFTETSSPYGEEYRESVRKLQVLSSVQGILADQHFAEETPDRGIKYLISALEIAAFIRTAGGGYSLQESAQKTKALLMVLQKNINAIKAASPESIDNLQGALKRQNIVSAIRRTVAAETYFEAKTIVHLFGLQKTDLRVTLKRAKHNQTVFLMKNNILRWICRPLLIQDAGKYIDYKLNELTTFWKVTNDDALLEKNLAEYESNISAESASQNTWRGSWAEMLEDLRDYSKRAEYLDEKESPIELLKVWLPTHRLAQKLTAEVREMTK